MKNTNETNNCTLTKEQIKKMTIADLCKMAEIFELNLAVAFQDREEFEQEPVQCLTTKEQVIAAVGSLQPKSVFNYGGVNWLVLERKGGGVLCLAEKILFNKAFDDDNCNNWEDSSLREYLNNDFLEELIDNGWEAAFMPMVTDLTADDGLKDYGTCEDLISLISCQQYRQYRGIIPNVDGYWWTCTAYSTKANGYSYIARIVYSGGSLYSGNACYGNGGVRPLCTLKSSILVSVINAAEGEEPEGAQ